MNICPNCGYRHAREDYAPELAGFGRSRRQQEVILRLSQAHGSLVHTDQLIDFVYGDDEDGGPLDARACLQVHITKARQKINRLGWTIVAERFRGYRLVRMS